MSDFTNFNDAFDKIANDTTQRVRLENEKLLILFHFGKTGADPFGGYGVVDDKEVIFWEMDENYHIFQPTQEWQEKIKNDQRELRQSLGFRTDYGPLFARRFDFDEFSVPNKPHMRSYQLAEIQIKYLGFVQKPDVLNLDQNDLVEGMSKYFDQ